MKEYNLKVLKDNKRVMKEDKSNAESQKNIPLIINFGT